MKRFLTFVVAPIAALLAALLVPAIASAVELPAQTVGATYTYNTHTRSIALACVGSERGPPTAYDHGAASNAVDRPRCVSLFPASRTTHFHDSRDCAGPLASVGQASPTNRKQEWRADVSSPSFARIGVAAKTATDAEDVLKGVRLNAQLTGDQIAGGHASEKHILDLGEFPGIRTRAQFASHIEDVVMNGEMRTLSAGRTAYWRDGTVVIRNPRAVDGGTAFQPTDGYDYFLNQLH